MSVPERDGGDVLIVGAGLAGLFTALALADDRHGTSGLRITLVSADEPGKTAASAWAQGGIAAAVGANDSPGLHATDTIKAGAGIVNEAVACLVADEAPERIADLIRFGVPFDRTAQGDLALGREAAHSRNRIVRVTGDRAGAVITQTLAGRAAETPSIRIESGLLVHDLLMSKGHVAGVVATDIRTGACVALRAAHVVLATGGAGALYATATTPLAMLGTGLGLAARAGALIADAEFVQFHPTAMMLDRDPAPLATEALRGEGAVLVTQTGDAFMRSVHVHGDLAPRDVVARAIHSRIMAGDRVFLDCRAAIGSRFAERFPTVYGLCREAGIDPVTMPIPVAPAAHYHMGGIAVDHDGRTSLPRLWACGEVSATGLHGANRLASNSLAEAIVMGGRAAEALKGETMERAPSSEPGTVSTAALPSQTPALARLRQTMTRHAGLVRSAGSLKKAARTLTALHEKRALPETVTAAASLIVAGAYTRTESRGSHFRSDFPHRDERQAKRSFLTLDEAMDTLNHMAADEAAPRKAAR